MPRESACTYLVDVLLCRIKGLPFYDIHETMASLLLLALAVSILPSALSQEFEEVPYCKDGGKALMEEVISHTVRNIDSARYKLEKGIQWNGPTTNKVTFLPKAKNFTKVLWNCKLEKDAMTLLGNKCPETAPKTPAAHTGLFFKRDGFEGLSYISAIDTWLDQINRFPLIPAAITGKTVTYQGDLKTFNYVNLIRQGITAIGCAQATCTVNGIEKYRAYCLINRPPLTKGQVVYPKA
ncbi:SCP-like protein [Ancylostoma caninum]|uniref:SCP-like protein n=1 Tax=Ancylostoma caninum TaxID=29170 RepID=A0A368GJE3_ANCCA|nr:SCP-like protein [Ancylostoma caninum]